MHTNALPLCVWELTGWRPIIINIHVSHPKCKCLPVIEASIWIQPIIISVTTFELLFPSPLFINTSASVYKHNLQASLSWCTLLKKSTCTLIQTGITRRQTITELQLYYYLSLTGNLQIHFLLHVSCLYNPCLFPWKNAKQLPEIQ